MDSESFKNTFLPYHKKMYKIAFRLLGNAYDAQDAVQDAFVKLWNKRNDLSKVSNTDAFAVIVLRNICLDFLKKGKIVFTNYDEEIADTQSFAYEIELHEKVQEVRKIVQQLPENQRQVMIMRHWNELTDEKIAQATGLSAANIRVLLSRARKTIREKCISIYK
jgi:RNA polymerase sigma-70 factor (ECF subfamily)